MTIQWLWLAVGDGGSLISPDTPRLALEVARLPSGTLTARWRDVVTGETSEACAAPGPGNLSNGPPWSAPREARSN